MTLKRWGRLLLMTGLAGAALSFAPALLLMLLGADGGFFGTVAILLTVTVTPIAVLAASAGVILLLAGALRRDPS